MTLSMHQRKQRVITCSEPEPTCGSEIRSSAGLGGVEGAACGAGTGAGAGAGEEVAASVVSSSSSVASMSGEKRTWLSTLCIRFRGVFSTSSTEPSSFFSSVFRVAGVLGGRMAREAAGERGMSSFRSGMSWSTNAIPRQRRNS